jgi:hypothetical protein
VVLACSRFPVWKAVSVRGYGIAGGGRLTLSAMYLSASKELKNLFL